MLECNEKEPDIGDEFIFKLGAWLEPWSLKAAKIVRELRFDETSRISAKQKKKNGWEFLYTGDFYTLEDLDKSDVQGLLRIWKNGAKKSWPTLVKRWRKIFSNTSK